MAIKNREQLYGGVLEIVQKLSKETFSREQNPEAGHQFLAK